MHAIIALWCHPRSMSTAMERVMRERGDLHCFHEPFMYDYYIHRKVRPMPMFEPDPARPVDYDSIKQLLLNTANQKPVFFKDMSYYVVSQLNSDPSFSSRLKNIFLIRDPRLSIPSYFKLDKELTLEEVGVESSWKHAKWIADLNGKWPLILNADTICSCPEQSVSQLFASAELNSSSKAMDWSTTVPAQWHEVSGWHQSVMNSTGLKTAQSAQNPDEVFSNEAKINPNLSFYLEHHMPFYEKLLKISQQQSKAWLANQE